MRVGLISYNAQRHNAIGNALVEKASFFQERGADVRVFLQSLDRLHPALRDVAVQVVEPATTGVAWDYLASADLVSFEYAQACALFHFLPLLADQKPRLIVDYYGITPPELWRGPNAEGLRQGQAMRGLAWCADAVIVHSRHSAHELTQATGLPAERITRLGFPIVVSRGSQTRAGLRLAGIRTTLLFVGRLAANKRLPVLVEALALLRDLQPPVHAIVIGDNGDVYADEAMRCRELADRLGVADRLHIFGQVEPEELDDAYRSADVLVMPSIHEGFCLPVLEAQAAGLPVIAARAAALPETVGDAGLTFTPDDADDLARQIRRVLWGRHSCLPEHRQARMPAPRKVAIACFRFGPGIVGGAEASLHAISRSLQHAGRHVEIFTTCTQHESTWSNELPEGTNTWDNLPIHRFALDAHDRSRHLQTNRAVIEANGRMTPDQEAEYLRHSIHSTKLVEALGRRITEFDAVIVGPYLFGLTHDVAQRFAEKTLVLPCFHDEPHARLKTWLTTYSNVGGILYHSPEEQDFAQTELGLNHPHAIVTGTFLSDSACRRASAPGSGSAGRDQAARRYLLYCGRFVCEKNVPLLLEYLKRYQEERGGRWNVMFAGQGDVPLPRASWLQDLGNVEPQRRNELLAGAAALIQLSTRESLSLVALEAWAAGTPVIVHRDCAVLAGQIGRSGGGRTIGDYDSFARTLDDLWNHEEVWRRMGENGRRHVQAHYSDQAAFTTRLVNAIEGLGRPLAEHMRQRGLAKAAASERNLWRQRFGRLIDQVLHEPAAPRRVVVKIQFHQQQLAAAPHVPTLLIPVRLHNQGNLPVTADGPARLMLFAQVFTATGAEAAEKTMTPLPSLLQPGRSLPAALTVASPAEPGGYLLRTWVGCDAEDPSSSMVEIPFIVGAGVNSAATGSLLEPVQAALAEMQRLQRLPDDYQDVTLGRFARLKRWIKRKLLGNFKTAYVDVLSRQQSRVNQQVLTAVHHLAECCATLDHAVRNLQQATTVTKPAGVNTKIDNPSPTFSDAS